MYIILLLMVLNKFVRSDDDSDESSKYIDLLPEKEKEEFLQRIARRILADVTTRDDREKYDGEVSEDELNTHHEFVQKIVKEESDNHRKIDRREKDKDEMMEMNENPEDNLKVKSLETYKDSLNRGADEKYIDLTLRHGKRDKRNENSQEISVEVQVDKLPDKQHTLEVNSKENVDIINEDHEEFTQIQQEESSTIGSIEPKNIEESDSEDIRIKPSRRNKDNYIKNDTNSSQILKTDSSVLYITQSHATPDYSNDEYNISEPELQLKDIATTYSPEEESITVTNDKEETTPQEINDELAPVYYNTDEKHNISESSIENIAITENHSRKNLNNNVTDEAKSDIKRATADVTSADNIMVEVTNESTIETAPGPEEEEITVTKVPEEATSQETNDELTTVYYNTDEKHNISESSIENIAITENNSRDNLSNNVTDETKSYVKRATTDVKSADNIMVEVTNESTIETAPGPEEEEITVTKVPEEATSQETNDELTTVYYNTDEKHNISESSIENIAITENNSRDNLSNNVTDETKSYVKRATTDVKSADNIIVEEVANERTIETTPGPEEEVITVTKVTEEITSEETNVELTTAVYDKSDEQYNFSSSQRDNSIEIIATTENYSSKNLNNNVTNEAKSDIEIATANTSVDDNIVEEITNERTIADQKQDNTKDDTKYQVEITSKDNIEIQNIAILRNNESPSGATAHSNVVANLNESVETTDIITESTINNTSSIETMSNKVNITRNLNNNLDNPVATTVKYKTYQNDTIHSQQGSQLNNQDTEKAKGKVSITKNVDALKIKYNKKSNLREYNVFEVPRGEPPFVKKAAPTNQEQPYYVPVHNYEPNNAYFNAHNRLGPNYDSDNPPYRDREDEKPKDINERGATNFEADYFFDSKEKAFRKFRFRVSTKKPKSSKKPRTYSKPIVVSKSKYTDIYFNPDDYVDVDYYFSKMKRGLNKGITQFPNSSDEDHPYKSIAGQGLKDHIRAVRNMLWGQNNLGFIPQSTNLKDKHKEKPDVTATTVKYKEDIETFRSIDDKDNPKLDTNKNIAVDHYFGRMQNEDIKKIGYIIKNNIHKDLFLKTEEIPSDNIVADIKVIKFNDKQYVNEDVKSVAPHRFLLTDISEENEEDIFQKLMERSQKPIKGSHSKIYTAIQKHRQEDSIDTIAKVAKIADMKDIFMHIQSMLSMKMPITRKNNDDIDVYVKVLYDMIEKDDLSLKRYDWLETTVDIRAALAKLIDLTELWQVRAILDPADIELLNYTLFLHKSAKELTIKKELEQISKVLRKPLLLPRNKKKKKKLLLKEKGLLQRAWLLRRKIYNEINNLKALLNDLQYYLYDLHEAIKNIALEAKYKNQKWYGSLKKIYLSSNKRTMLEVILHLTTTTLLGLIEESAQSGLEDDFIEYILHHEKEVNRTVEEFIFVLKIIDELKMLDN